MRVLMWNSVGVLVAVACVGVTLGWLYLLGRVAVLFVRGTLSL